MSCGSIVFWVRIRQVGMPFMWHIRLTGPLNRGPVETCQKLNVKRIEQRNPFEGLQFDMFAAACPPLKPNPPSKLTVKAQFLCE